MKKTKVIPMPVPVVLSRESMETTAEIYNLLRPGEVINPDDLKFKVIARLIDVQVEQTVDRLRRER